jgi:hypothetical protein
MRIFTFPFPNVNSQNSIKKLYWFSFYESYYPRQCKTKQIFQPEHFLSLIGDRQLSIAGDSSARQYFIDLISELSKFESGKYPHNYDQFSAERKLESFHYHKRFYESYNTTIIWCEDGRVDQLNRLSNANTNCTIDVISNIDYIVIGVGEWYYCNIQNIIVII